MISNQVNEVTILNSVNIFCNSGIKKMAFNNYFIQIITSKYVRKNFPIVHLGKIYMQSLLRGKVIGM